MEFRIILILSMAITVHAQTAEIEVGTVGSRPGASEVNDSDDEGTYSLDIEEQDVTALQNDITVWVSWSGNATDARADVTALSSDRAEVTPDGARAETVDSELTVELTVELVHLASAETVDAAPVGPGPGAWRVTFPCGTVQQGAGRVTDRHPLKHFYERGHDLRLGCERLERQAFFQLQLVANVTDKPLVAWSNVMRVRWSRRFRLKVRGENGGSVFPCRAGVEVYFGRPRCAGGGDRLRLSGVERADVASAAPPTIERYVGERRVSGESSAVSFECADFSERFVRYCVSYMAFGWSGAVYLVRKVCIPTQAATLVTDGGFGPWSAWSPCEGSCGASSRVRYRFCNSPQPRNNGAFCQGETTQSRPCRLPPTCRCGCDVLLSRGQNYTLAASAHHCRGTSFWRFETSDGSVLQLRFSYFRLNGSAERLRARDGAFSNSELLMDASGAARPPAALTSAGCLLLQYSGVEAPTDPGGGFLASVTAVASNGSSTARLAAASAPPAVNGVGVLAICFLSVIMTVVIAAGSYQAWKARRLAATAASMESLYSRSGGGGGGGDAVCSLCTSVTSVAESAVVLRLRRRPSKRSKELENRRRLLVRSDTDETLKPADSASGLSAASTVAELELDYYDYDVANASQAPGSYFGMDPLQLSLCAYDYDATPTEDLEMTELSEAEPRSQVTEVTEVTEITEVARGTDADGILFADDTDEEGSIQEDKD
ncbi:uncharacterized protein LOC119092580 [Pollicipes pollicipes]|uniref:uncharacterized protein LOC119092580 n=1 Tax=Pollicipes pollicipes TaxID=41117 RepID=UPI0018858D24|nr:uncharacterized protein LOC119092580 [Pollicipes pollicipes]